MPTVWPFSPAGIDERLIFSTDIRQSATQEMRDSLHSGVCEYALAYRWPDDREAAEAEQAFRENALGEWYVPQWPEATRFVGTIASGAGSLTSIEIDADYYAGGLAIIWKDHRTFETVTIASVGGGTLTLTGTTSAAYTGTANDPVMIAPVATCVAVQPLNTETRYGVVSGAVTFRATLPRDLASGAVYSLLSGSEVLTDSSVVASALPGSVTQQNTLVSNGLGSIELVSSRDIVERRSQIVLFDADHSDRWARKTWFHRLRGRDATFWLPTWKDDLNLIANIGAADTTITVQTINSDLSELVGRGILIWTDTQRHACTVTAAATALGGMDLDISAATGFEALTPVTKVSLMSLSRLDTDEVLFVHRYARNGLLTEVSATVVEVPE